MTVGLVRAAGGEDRAGGGSGELGRPHGNMPAGPGSGAGLA
jgi:hypothetical protein